MEQQLLGETDNCRSRLIQYCGGQGLDLGCGSVKIKLDTIGIDLQNPNADMHMDAQDLGVYSDGHFDYVYSSHLLEEIEDTESTLREWLRVVKPGGNIVLYQADKDLYFPIGDPRCNISHKHHYNWEDLWAICQKIGGMSLIHHDRHPETKEWSFELVVQKNGGTQVLPNMKIALLCPTRARKDMQLRLLQSIVETKVTDSVVLYFGVDDDDPSRQETCNMVEKYPFLKIVDIHNKGEFLGLGKVWNLMVKDSPEEILAMVGDDMVFDTKGWDRLILEEFSEGKLPPDKFKMVFCNDGYRGPGNHYKNLAPLAVNSFMHRVYYETVGYYVREEWKHGWHDNWIEDIFTALGRKVFRSDILIKHLHWSNPEIGEKKDIISQTLQNSTCKGISYNDPKLQEIRKREILLIKNKIKDSN